MPVDARALTLHRPRNLKAALAMLANEPTLTPIAGCTDVMVGLHFGTSDQRQFIDLWPLDELRGIMMDKPSTFARSASADKKSLSPYPIYAEL